MIEIEKERKKERKDSDVIIRFSNYYYYFVHSINFCLYFVGSIIQNL